MSTYPTENEKADKDLSPAVYSSESDEVEVGHDVALKRVIRKVRRLGLTISQVSELILV